MTLVTALPLTRMLQGVQGDISRQSAAQTESVALGATPFPQFGIAGKIVGNLFIPPTATADPIYGLLVRTLPTQGANASDPIGTGVPPTSGVATVLTRGYAIVNVQAGSGSVAPGSAVYVRFQTPSGNVVIGGIEGATSANNYVLTYARFTTGVVDANGNAEIFIDNVAAHL